MEFWIIRMNTSRTMVFKNATCLDARQLLRSTMPIFTSEVQGFCMLLLYFMSCLCRQCVPESETSIAFRLACFDHKPALFHLFQQFLRITQPLAPFAADVLRPGVIVVAESFFSIPFQPDLRFLFAV